MRIHPFLYIFCVYIFYITPRLFKIFINAGTVFTFIKNIIYMPSRCEKHLFDNVCMFFKFYPRPLFTFQGKEEIIMLKILYSGPDDFDTVALDEFITEPGSNFDDEDDMEF